MRTHRFEATSLLFGLFFTGIGLTFLRGDVDVWRLDWSWFWPVLLVLAGVLVVSSARAKNDHSESQTDAGPPQDPGSS